MNYYRAPGGKLQPVDVVIPALNEAKTVEDVVKTFRQGRNIGNIIVVSDLSTDRTSIIARNAGATVVKGPGAGKGEAMIRGLKEVTTPRVIFADADLHGLQPRHVNALAMPAFGMVVGYRDKGGMLNNFGSMFTMPPIAGERSLPTKWARELDLEGYGAETQINNAVVARKMRIWHFVMKGVTGTVKAGPLRAIDVAPYVRLPQFVQYSRLVRWLPPV